MFETQVAWRVGDAFSIAVGLLSGGNIAISAAAKLYVTDYLKCLEEKGASATALYSDPKEPTDTAIVAVQEENLGKIIQCIFHPILPLTKAAAKTYGLYAIKYSFRTKYTTFHVLALATTDRIARALCNKLPACKSSDITKITVGRYQL